MYSLQFKSYEQTHCSHLLSTDAEISFLPTLLLDFSPLQSRTLNLQFSDPRQNGFKFSGLSL